MMEFFRHLFTPHHTNNQRAKLLHHDSIFLFSAGFFLLAISLSLLRLSRPDILGITTAISTQDLLTLTNQQRQQQGLPLLSYNQELAVAAKLKADDMFHDNYWAHISPVTGRTPWVFIQEAGYQYIYAGENLARGFNNAQDAIAAWMASPTHRANILSPNYQEIGFAVENGTLTGEANTVLIVEMFGGKNPVPLYGSNPPATKQVLSDKNNAGAPATYPSYSFTPLIDRMYLSKNLVQILLSIFIVILLLDIILIKRKNLPRLIGHNLDHILFLGGLFIVILIIKGGTIF